MGRLVGIEIRKTVRGRMFRAALFFVGLMILADVWLALQRYARLQEFATIKFADPLFGGVNPYARRGNLFFYLPGANLGSFEMYLSMYALPLLICFGVGGSLAHEIRRGYRQQVIIRVGKSAYYASKFSGAFLLGGLLNAAPLLMVSAVLALLLPQAVPQVAEDIMHQMRTPDSLAELYFSQPWLCVLVVSGFQFLYGGLWACTSLSVSFFVRTSRAAAISAITPFIGLISWDYIAEIVFHKWEVSPIIFLNLSNRAAKHFVPLMLLLAVGFGLAIAWIVRRKGVCADVL